MCSSKACTKNILHSDDISSIPNALIVITRPSSCLSGISYSNEGMHSEVPPTLINDRYVVPPDNLSSSAFLVVMSDRDAPLSQSTVRGHSRFVAVFIDIICRIQFEVLCMFDEASDTMPSVNAL